MASTSIEKEQIIDHSGAKSDPVIIEHDPQTSAPKSSANATASISSQKQLLVLARKFSLDAALLPENKQAPLEDRSYRRKKLDELRQQQNM